MPARKRERLQRLCKRRCRNVVSGEVEDVTPLEHAAYALLVQCQRTVRLLENISAPALLELCNKLARALHALRGLRNGCIVPHEVALGSVFGAGHSGWCSLDDECGGRWDGEVHPRYIPYPVRHQPDLPCAADELTDAR